MSRMLLFALALARTVIARDRERRRFTRGWLGSHRGPARSSPGSHRGPARSSPRPPCTPHRDRLSCATNHSAMPRRGSPCCFRQMAHLFWQFKPVVRVFKPSKASQPPELPKSTENTLTTGSNCQNGPLFRKVAERTRTGCSTTRDRGHA